MEMIQKALLLFSFMYMTVLHCLMQYIRPGISTAFRMQSDVHKSNKYHKT